MPTAWLDAAVEHRSSQAFPNQPAFAMASFTKIASLTGVYRSCWRPSHFLTGMEVEESTITRQVFRVEHVRFRD
jgi:hypothetical protein